MSSTPSNAWARKTPQTLPTRHSFMRTLRCHARAIHECTVHCAHHAATTLLSACLLALMITLPLVFVLLLSNHPQSLRQYIQTTPSISVYLQPDLSPEQQQAIQKKLKTWDNVARITTVSPKQGMQQLEQAMNIESLSTLLPTTILPRVLVIVPTCLLYTSPSPRD